MRLRKKRRIITKPTFDALMTAAHEARKLSHRSPDLIQVNQAGLDTLRREIQKHPGGMDWTGAYITFTGVPLVVVGQVPDDEAWLICPEPPPPTPIDPPAKRTWIDRLLRRNQHGSN